MIWSKQKKRVLANVIEGFQGRLDLGITRYRQSHDGEYGRCWISFEGKQIASWSCFETLLNSSVTAEEAEDHFKGHFSPRQFDDLNAEKGFFTVDTFLRSLNIYIDGKPNEFLNSTNHVQQALAISDRRVGRRKLELLQEHGEDFPDFIVFLLKQRQSQISEPQQSNPLAATQLKINENL